MKKYLVPFIAGLFLFSCSVEKPDPAAVAIGDYLLTDTVFNFGKHELKAFNKLEDISIGEHIGRAGQFLAVQSSFNSFRYENTNDPIERERLEDLARDLEQDMIDLENYKNNYSGDTSDVAYSKYEYIFYYGPADRFGGVYVLMTPDRKILSVEENPDMLDYAPNIPLN